jgi:hypothetical protein
MFIEDLLKIFHDNEEDDTFTRFTHLQQTWTINEYNHEWEVLATRFTYLIEDQLLKLYILRLKSIIHNELRLSRPKNLVEAKSMAKIIENKSQYSI